MTIDNDYDRVVGEIRERLKRDHPVNQIKNKNLGAQLAEMESQNPSLRTRADIVHLYLFGYEPIMDRVGTDFEINQPKYKRRNPVHRLSDWNDDCDSSVDDYKPGICALGVQYMRDGQLLGHDGATADRPRRDEEDFGLGNAYDDDCGGCVDDEPASYYQMIVIEQGNSQYLPQIRQLLKEHLR